MSSIRNKLALLLVGGLTALALAAPSALATYEPPFTPGDDDPSHWKAVIPYNADGESCDLAPCSLSASTGGGGWALYTPAWNPLNCSLSLDGQVSGDGSTVIEDLEIGGEWPCYLADDWNAPFSGRICVNTQTNEYWFETELRIKDTADYFIVGETYGKIQGEPTEEGGIEAQGIGFGESGSPVHLGIDGSAASNPPTITGNEILHHGTVTLEDELELLPANVVYDPEEYAVDCGFNGLQ